MITPDTVVVGVDPFDIDHDTFRSILHDNASPALAEASSSYTTLGGFPVSIAFLLAIFHHESQYGKLGICAAYNTKSPGNTRSTRIEVGTVLSIPGRGPFVRYPTWLDGWRDMAWRLLDPSFAYHREGRVTIRQVIERWAPTSDGNAPDSYMNAVVRDMNEWIAPEPAGPSLTPPPGWTPPEVVRRILPRNASNTPQRRMVWQYITVHNTGNPNPGADALNHATWLEGLALAGRSEPSWYATVDEKRVVLHLEEDQPGWHASDGNGPGNLESLGYELVEIGDQERVLWNAGWHIAQRLRERNKDVSWLRQHHDWARDKKNCPRLLRANGGAGWRRLLGVIDHFLAEPQPTPEPSDRRVVPETGAALIFGFKGFYERLEQAGLALLVLGYPLADERPVQGIVGVQAAQRFERGWLVYEPANAAPWDVHLATVEQQIVLEDQ